MVLRRHIASLGSPCARVLRALALCAVATQGCTGTELEAGPDGQTAHQDGPYQLCDGSPDVRLAIQSGGGHVDTTYAFTNPHGFQFLYVTGDCHFIAGVGNSTFEGLREGTLSDEQATTLSQRLSLTRLSGIRYIDVESCPDAGLLSLTTARGYADCTCGCDEDAPSFVRPALDAVMEAFTLVATAGAPLSGPVELIALEIQKAGVADHELVQTWPFSWPVSEIGLTQRQFSQSAVERARVLEGGEAVAARALREAARTGRAHQIYVQEGNLTYSVFVRDQIAPALEQSSAAFRVQHDPWTPKPLTMCEGEPLSDLEVTNVQEYRGVLSASVEQTDACPLELCWDGGFNESYPVQTSLRPQRAPAQWTCLGRRDLQLTTDLGPLKEAFRQSYPRTPVEINLNVLGSRERLAVDDWQLENAHCTPLSLSACADDPLCRVLSAAPVDLTRGCREAPRPAACVAKVNPCDAAIIPARAADRSTWLAPDGCLPATWSSLDSAEPRLDMLPECNP